MAKQLIFGSVPHGLQPGRSGYCLIAGHTDLPQSLIRQLEQETSVFPARDQPIAPSHQIRKTGDIEWHLFTHQTVNIQDYTGRLSGITHVIAERVDQFPAHLNPEILLQTFKGWVTSLPAAPKTFGAEEEIDLGFSKGRNHPGQPVKPADMSTAQSSGNEGDFRLNPASNRAQPAPRPRSGFYYHRRRKRSLLGRLKRSPYGWWIGLGTLLAIGIILIVR